MSRLQSILMAAVVLMAGTLPAITTSQPGVGPGGGARYATDAYPGFDNESEIVAPERKEPKWFSFINGPNRANATEQFAYCQELKADGNYSKAAKHFDALVRQWPASPEAPRAQQEYAELLMGELADYEDALTEYRYLLDFYSSSCNYAEIADKMYKVANVMRLEGKTIMFFRFKNTVDVRRAYESCVLRAPGAEWASQALLTIGELREEEGKYDEAVKVYENLRNLYAGSTEAKQAFVREADARMVGLREHGYNRDRCRDTLSYLKLALRGCNLDDVEHIKAQLAEAEQLIAEEAFASAKFYDSKTRTVRSAINAYELFIAEYPESAHAAEAERRLDELRAVQFAKEQNGAKPETTDKESKK